jgi:hypothetical protein
MKTQKGISTIAGITIFVVVAVFTFGGVFAYEYYLEKNEQKTEGDQNTEPTACTMEAKVCPDGSSVGRAGPNCEFADCPLVDETAGWKTYSGNGFSFKYPSDYKSQEIPTDSPTGLSINLPRGNTIVHEINNAIININLPDDCMFSSSALEDKNMLSFIETKKINGINFYHYINYKSMSEYLGGYCGMSAGCWHHDVYRTFYNGKCYEMAYDRSDRVFYGVDEYRGATQEEMNVPEVFDQIMSTFKFTN